MASQLSKKAALPLAKILATCRNNVSNTGPWPSVTGTFSWLQVKFRLTYNTNGLYEMQICAPYHIWCWCSSLMLTESYSPGPINITSVFVQIMTWCHAGDRPIYYNDGNSLFTHLCVTSDLLVTLNTTMVPITATCVQLSIWGLKYQDIDFHDAC